MKIPTLRLPIVQKTKQPWWIRIETEIPTCTYYFGPFDNKKEAKTLQVGYVDDLLQEGAQNITIHIEKTAPQQLTVHGTR